MPPASRARKAAAVTEAAPKYGAPTSLFGSCEHADCEARARAECSTCHGHFCLGHVDHPAHTSS